MEELLSGLTRQQTMLLLATATFGGQEAPKLLEHLSPEEGELLGHRAGKLMEIPREKRIPAMAHEIRRLLSWRSTRMGAVDPKELAKLLRRERLTTRALILRALPENVAQAVRQNLPPESQGKVGKELGTPLMEIIRWKLEGLLEKAASADQWKFSDLLALWPREILTLVDRQGVRALGQAFAALDSPAREASFAPLAPDLRLIAEKATSGASARALRPDDAQALLAHHGFERSAQEAIRSAGAQRLARAALAQSPAFAEKLVGRQPRNLSGLLSKWMSDPTTAAAARGDGGRSEVVLDLERMAARGLVERPQRLLARSRAPGETTSTPSGSALPHGPSVLHELTAPQRRLRGSGGGSGGSKS